MQLLLVRHADAVDVGGDVTNDGERYLTPRGLVMARKLGEALVTRRTQLGAVVSSPFIRAKQTAEPLLQLAPPGQEMVMCEHLLPMAQNPKGCAAAVAGLGVQSAAVVGHLPDIAVFAGWLIGGGTIGFARGAAALIETDERITPGNGTLKWLITPDWYT